MATMITVKFGNVMLQIGDGANVGESFDEICGIIGYSHDYNITTDSEQLPDCENPEALLFERLTKVSVGESVSFNGFVSPDSHPKIRELVYETEDRNVRLVFTKAPLVGYLEGPAILTAAQGGVWEQRKSGTYTGTISFQAKPVWVPG